MRDAGQEVDAMEDSSLWYILNRNTTIRVRAGMKNSRPVGFLL
jgi:hypothetical protein